MSEQDRQRHAAVLVTGAARGLGAAMAEALAALSVEPFLLGRSRECLEHVRTEGAAGERVPTPADNHGR